MLFDIEGFDELAQWAANFRERLEEAAANTVQRCLDVGEQIALEEVPVDTGALRDSIHQEIESQYYGELIADTEYADYVEYGTSKMEAQPYMEPAAMEIDRNIDDIINEELDNAAAS